MSMLATSRSWWRRGKRAEHSAADAATGQSSVLATDRVDGRKGIDRLSVMVRSQFGEDPLSGTLFVFFSKRADRVRVLYWDRDGYVLTMKRLDQRRFSFLRRSMAQASW